MNIDKTYELPYSANVIYDAWISSESVIAPVTSLDINPVVGGHYRLTIQTSEYFAKNEGKFLEIAPGSHLRYTWEWNDDGKATVISVRFTDFNSGSRVQIRHTGFNSTESLEMHSTGWDSYIDGLKQLLIRNSGEKNGE